MAPDSFTLSPDELAGLACEEEFESRLIIEDGDGAWTLRHGPFSDDDFASLPDSRWTLLVQDVDKYVPEVARLIEGFDFVPAWRIDDIMISYATDQGGVGPHTDAYDVFLMQARGRRRWRISERPYTDADLIPGLEQRILSHFETEQEWVLEPGDVLYLPPGVAHWGTAEGECVTYSLGFRAPSQQDLAADWYQYLVSLAGDRRLSGPGSPVSSSPAELDPAVFDQARDLLDLLPDTRSRAFRLWLGRHLTEPKPQFQIMPPADSWETRDLDELIARGSGLRRHPFARTAWARLSDQELALFYQGHSLIHSPDREAAVKQLADRRRLAAADLATLIDGNTGNRDLLLQLINEGILEPDEDD